MTLLQVADIIGLLADIAGLLADIVGLFIALPLRETRASMPLFLSVKEDYRRHPQAYGRPISRRQTQET